MIEEQRRDPQTRRVELIEDLLRVVGAVIVPDTGVVAADDEVGAAVVLAHDGVEDRLARAGVAHRRGQHTQKNAVGGVVPVQQHAVAAHAHVRGNVVALGLTNERV